MKLLSSTNLYSLAVYMVVFCLGGFLFFFLFQIIIDRDLERKLIERKNYVVKQISNSDSLFFYQRLSANTISIRQTNVAGDVPETLSDTVIYDEIEHRHIRYRQLAFIASGSGVRYQVHIRRTLVEQTDLIKGVVALVTFLFLAFVVILTFLNNQLSKRIWKPFYEILDTINSYRVDIAGKLSFPRNRITEFNELAGSIEKMSAKINKEFNIQKEFIENASHEIQTPLAIIRNKMEELLQLPELTERQMESISKASQATNRLTKLNEALLILSRIENRQFHAVEDICVNELLDNHLKSFEELLQMKSIRVVRKGSSRVFIKMNHFLADILMENLIINAIKHNSQYGVISVSLSEGKLVIANTGESVSTDPMKLFERFAKGNAKSSSLGLGLPIVKAICETYLMPIQYSSEKGLHTIQIEFNV